MGAAQEDLARSGEPLETEHAVIDSESAGGQRPAARVGQGRPGEVESPADLGAVQANLAGGNEPLVELEVARVLT